MEFFDLGLTLRYDFWPCQTKRRMMMKWAKCGIAAVALVMSTNLMAKGSSHDVSPKAKQLVKKVAGSSQLSIETSFQGIGNLDGFVVAKKGGDSDQKALIYADDQGRYLVSGQVISAQGDNITRQDHSKYITSKKAPKVLKQAKQTHFFEQGKQDAPHKAYILIEPNCIACHSLYQHIHSYIDQGKLAVRWIPVAFRKQNSMNKAAAIMTADHPSKALAKNEKNFDKKTETGGIKPMDNVPSDVKQKIKSNMQFMMKNEIRVTPVVIYSDDSGKAHMMKGYPGKKAFKQALNNMSSQF